MDSTNQSADVVIVGGGSAGAVLAARLSENPDRSVLLLEAGVVYAPETYPQEILNAASVADPGHDWGYIARGNELTAKVPSPRGKVIGGSSAVNAAVALRARPADFDVWAAHGVEGWSWDDVLPDFKRLENTPTGDGAFHGRSGPLPVRQRQDAELTPSLRAFIAAAVASGYSRVADYNGAEQDGAGGYPVNIVDEVRQNTAMAYLDADVRARANLTIIGNATVDRVVFDGARATGVVAADGTTYTAGEVILSGGTYGSPAILMRSGVGPADHLRGLGIEVVTDLPVGRRLHDQPFFYNAYALAPDALDMSPATGALLWTGSSEAEAGELDLHVSATHLMDGSFSPTGGAIVLAVAVTRPESFGTLELASRNPGDAPVINDNFLTAGGDQRRMLEGVKLSRSIGRHPAFASLVAAEMIPGDAVADDETLAQVIQSNIASYGHPTSTVPMGGPDDPWGVVDSYGLVKEVTGLRVVDASIMPEVPSTATNLTTIMIAEHIARVVYGA
jgi:choline dehydrogenase